MNKKIKIPITEKEVKNLKAGDKVLLTGVLYTARDEAHKRFVELIKKGKKLPVDLRNQVIYYTGPTPAKPGKIIGSAGPTTSSRMDAYTIPLLEKGLKGMIGKGDRSKEVKAAIKKNKAVYFLATGGAGAFISKRIKKAEIIAFPELGPEAVLKLEVEDMPVYVAFDCRGDSIFNPDYSSA